MLSFFFKTDNEERPFACGTNILLMLVDSVLFRVFLFPFISVVLESGMKLFFVATLSLVSVILIDSV